LPVIEERGVILLLRVVIEAHEFVEVGALRDEAEGYAEGFYGGGSVADLKEGKALLEGSGGADGV